MQTVKLHIGYRNVSHVISHTYYVYTHIKRDYFTFVDNNNNDANGNNSDSNSNLRIFCGYMKMCSTCKYSMYTVELTYNIIYTNLVSDIQHMTYCMI